jgi:hypothetical protein
VCVGLFLGILGALAVSAQRIGGPKNATGGAGATGPPPPPPFTSYEVVRDADEARFEAAVRARIRDRWEPVGDVTYAPRENPGDAGTFPQSMATRQE